MFTRTNALRVFVLFTLSGLFAVPADAHADKPEAYLRFEQSGDTRSYYVAVYIKTPPAGGLDQIRASLRDVGDNKKLISTTIASAPAGDDSRFIFRLGMSEADIFARLPGYRVFVDSYPTTGGVEDHEISVAQDVGVALSNELAICGRQRTGILVGQRSSTDYGTRRFRAIVSFLDDDDVERSITATTTKETEPPETAEIKVDEPHLGTNPNPPAARVCFELASRPAGGYTLELKFKPSTPPELAFGTFTTKGKGPDGPDATAEKRNAADFLDLGLALTSSVAEQVQPDTTTKRVRTNRGVMDLFFAPVLNMRTVESFSGRRGLVQVFTPFYIDAKISTGKITKDTLALNRVELGSTYEFRQYRTKAYSDLFRHALSFKHNSDRDFKQDEFKFVYEFQPIWGRLNRPRGSALNILRGNPVPDTGDKFGYEIVPIVGVELGRTYRVKDPKQFAGTSRNVRRFYFGASMTFDLTRFVELSIADLFYVRGENPKDRTENYFVGSLEAPLGQIGDLNAAHALFLSFERGEQAPFTNPSVNILKFGYRIRARGFLIR
jgi:hypothetical protein